MTKTKTGRSMKAKERRRLAALLPQMKLKLYPLHRLKVGQSCIAGPYKKAKTVGTMIWLAKKKDGMSAAEYTQRKMILVDPLTAESVFMWIVTRTA